LLGRRRCTTVGATILSIDDGDDEPDRWCTTDWWCRRMTLLVVAKSMPSSVDMGACNISSCCGR
jgi:hypothetical protein